MFVCFVCLFFSKLKELSKRTTFIRVTQQINEVFGSRDESKDPSNSVFQPAISAATSTSAITAAVAVAVPTTTTDTAVNASAASAAAAQTA